MLNNLVEALSLPFQLPTLTQIVDKPIPWEETFKLTLLMSYGIANKTHAPVQFLAMKLIAQERHHLLNSFHFD